MRPGHISPLSRAKTIAIASAMLASLGLAACSDGDDSASSADALTLYSGRDESLVQPLIDSFTKDTGIKVKVRYGSTPDLSAQLLEEGTKSPADAFLSQDAGALGALGKSGLLAPVAPATLERVDSKFTAKDGTWVGVSGRARVLAYDSKNVTEAQVPQSVFDLTKPEWKGKVGIAPSNASFQSFVTAMRVISGEDKTKAWLKALSANQPKTFEGNGDVLKAVDAGQVSLGLVNHYYWYELAAEDGIKVVNAKISWLDKNDPGALVNAAGFGVLKSAKQSSNAQKLAEYLVGDSAQKYFSEKTHEYPLVKSVKQSSELPPLAEVAGPDIDLSQLEGIAATQSLLEEAGLI
ncbi:MAG: iron ABC transporter substrate-binding protein [Angustibacter sp.]